MSSRTSNKDHNSNRGAGSIGLTEGHLRNTLLLVEHVQCAALCINSGIQLETTFQERMDDAFGKLPALDTLQPARVKHAYG